MLPARGEALVVVDTDLPAPAVAGHFRVDFYSADGRWYDSRGLAVPDASRWPLSFSVYSEDFSRETQVVVRLRVYPDGRERDYRGERYEPPPSAGVDAGAELAPATFEDLGGVAMPPLVRDGGSDSAPATEPLPPVTVDRLVLLRLVPGSRGRVRVTLKARCIGWMAKLASHSLQPLSLSDARTCVDGGALLPLSESALEADMTLPDAATSLRSTFGTEQSCDAPGTADVACVPSAAFLFGGPRLGGVDISSTMPDRLVRVSRFWMDRREVSVARFRAALAQGFVPPTMPSTGFSNLNSEACAFTKDVGAHEGYALTCVTWATARAYCQFRGGDLPTEPQWELVATNNRPFKTRFPWGDGVPDCGRAIFGRAYPNQVTQYQGPSAQDCISGSLAGPSAITDGPDVNDLGIFNLGGGVSEWTRNPLTPLSAPCWTTAPIDDPSCENGRNLRVSRGGGWRSSAVGLDGLLRSAPLDAIVGQDDTGFRCVYSALPGGM